MMQVPSVDVTSVPDPLPEDLTVLDVREPVEWSHGRIEGAVLIPLTELPERRGELPEDGQLLVVCKVGGRSAQATAYLQQLGVDAANLEGGLLEWATAGRPLVNDQPHEPMVV